MVVNELRGDRIDVVPGRCGAQLPGGRRQVEGELGPTGSGGVAAGGRGEIRARWRGDRVGHPVPAEELGLGPVR